MPKAVSQPNFANLTNKESKDTAGDFEEGMHGPECSYLYLVPIAAKHATKRMDADRKEGKDGVPV